MIGQKNEEVKCFKALKTKGAKVVLALLPTPRRGKKLQYGFSMVPKKQRGLKGQVLKNHARKQVERRENQQIGREIGWE